MLWGDIPGKFCSDWLEVEASAPAVPVRSKFINKSSPASSPCPGENVLLPGLLTPQGRVSSAVIGMRKNRDSLSLWIYGEAVNNLYPSLLPPSAPFA